MVRRFLRRLMQRGPSGPVSGASPAPSRPPAPARAQPVVPGPTDTDPVPERVAGVPELLLFSSTSCGYCRRVLRAASELGIQLPIVDPRRDREAGKRLLSATGGSQVPCLFIDGEPMLESRDIIAWLRENHEQLQHYA